MLAIMKGRFIWARHYQRKVSCTAAILDKNGDFCL